MKISFAGFDTVLNLEKDCVSTFEILNKNLFCRVCESFISDKCLEAVEPYSCWIDDENKALQNERPFVIVSPLDLPWETRQFGALLSERMDLLMREDDEQRIIIEKTGQELLSLVSALCLQFDANYHFNLEWDLAKQLKIFGLSVNMDMSLTHIEKVESFVSYVTDVQFQKPLIFINFKSFFNEEDVQRFINFAIYHDRKVLLLESVRDESVYENERKYTVDQCFLEY